MNGAVVETPCSANYQCVGEDSMKMPCVSATRPSTMATPRQSRFSIIDLACLGEERVASHSPGRLCSAEALAPPPTTAGAGAERGSATSQTWSSRGEDWGLGRATDR